MPSMLSAIWRRLPADLASRTEQIVRVAGERLDAKGSGNIFFRADDVAAPGKNLDALLDIFRRHRVPLCLAVVPAWLTARRWQHLKGSGSMEPSLWCWHQHGWRHVNHETGGKKQEFGAGRSRPDIKHDLLEGKRHLERIMETDFYPVFTPPWNRCSHETLQLLRELGYAAVSRSCGSLPEAPGGLADFCVNVDLHTRGERDANCGWNNLFYDLQQALSSGGCGIMIHHQRMNAAAFDFLDLLVKTLSRCKEFRLVHFHDLANDGLNNSQWD